jgi:predicted dehydrogenase
MTISIAVIGVGFMGTFWARAIHEHWGARVAVIGDTDLGRGRSLAEMYNARYVADAVEAATAPGVDAVVVCTPEHLHLDATAAALAAKRPVAVEKPIAHTPEVADEMVHLAKAAGVPFFAAHILRFETRYGAMKQAIARGTIGNVLSVRNARVGTAGDRARLSARTTVALYYGVHELDIARWFAGDLVHIHGEGNSDLLCGAFRFASGAHGTVQVGWCLPDRVPGYGMAGVSVIGDRGVMRVTQGDDGIMIGGEDGLIYTDIAYVPEVHGRLGGMLAREVDHFIAVVAGREAPICTAEDGAAAVKAAIALERSAKENRLVALT